MRLFKIFNIQIRISYFILFILIFSMFFNYFSQILVLISVVLIHELAHCCAGKYFNIQISEIKLFAFGGVAKSNRDIETNPREEIMIALAGPLSNFLLLALILPIVHLLNIKIEGMVQLFLITNLSIGLFNLLPILPLDGGRILRGVIGYYIGVKKATTIVIKLGYFLCALLFTIGIYLTIVYNVEYIFLSMVSIYIITSNKKEKEKIEYIFIKNLVLKKKSLFSEGTMEAKYMIAMDFIEVKKIFDEFTLEKYHIITVINSRGKVIGSLSESEIIDAVIKYNNNITLGDLLDIYENRG